MTSVAHTLDIVSHVKLMVQVRKVVFHQLSNGGGAIHADKVHIYTILQELYEPSLEPNSNSPLASHRGDRIPGPCTGSSIPPAVSPHTVEKMGLPEHWQNFKSCNTLDSYTMALFFCQDSPKGNPWSSMSSSSSANVV